MAKPLRAPDLVDSNPTPNAKYRLNRLRDLLTSGAWNDAENIALVYWSPGHNQWVAWCAKATPPPPLADPIQEAEVAISKD